MNLKTIASISSILLISSLSAHAAAPEKCTYSVDTQHVQIDWTAFKTSQKVPVAGGFNEVTLIGELTKEATFEKFLGQLEAELTVRSEQSFHTGNPGRDLTIYQQFFKWFKNNSVVHGSIKNVVGNDLAGDFNLVLKMNEKKVSVPFKYTRDQKGGFIAKGAINLADFALEGALARLHKACEHLHKGPDGVSKTWSTVEIRLLSNIEKNCHS